MHIIERAAQHETGLRSKYFTAISQVSSMLDDEQLAIMALICENCTVPPNESQLRLFGEQVYAAQKMMPSGLIRSRQALVILATITGLR
jgi:hypothetical protein